MKKYEKMCTEIDAVSDIITTSAEVTTGKVQFPWTQNDTASSASYEVTNVNVLESDDASKFNI